MRGFSFQFDTGFARLRQPKSKIGAPPRKQAPERQAPEYFSVTSWRVKTLLGEQRLAMVN